MKNKKQFLKGAVILLITVVMVLSSGAAIANTNNQKASISIINTPENPISSPVNRAMIWDNVVGVHADLGGIIVATVRAEGTAYPADDFKLTVAQEVNHVFWQGGYFQCQLAQGQMDYQWDWRIIFWNDCGNETQPTQPGTEIYNVTYNDSLITREFWYNYTHPTNGNTYWVANYSLDLQPTITFNANTKYWITIQGIQGTNLYPQACWSRHNESVGGILLHEAVIHAAWWGYTDWTNISVLAPDKLPHDLNYQLYGPLQNNPPGEPSIDGQTAKLKVNKIYNYTFNAVDPDSDDVLYYVDWGDGNNSGWTESHASGTDLILNHTWTEKGTYIIKAKAKDVWSAESGWAELEITVPRSRAISSLLLQFLERFPNAFPILRLFFA